MADTSFAVTPGSGANLHTVSTSIGGSTVHDQVVKHGEPYLATYIVNAGPVSIATADSHVLQLMAGGTLNVYLRRLRVTQLGLATTAAIARFDLRRLTTAGTGGGAATVSPVDTTDAAAGATAMTLPTVKGTESTLLDVWGTQVIQTVGTGGAGLNPVLFDYTWDASLRTKPFRIAAGTSNGIALKIVSATAAATVLVHVVLAESNF